MKAINIQTGLKAMWRIVLLLAMMFAPSVTDAQTILGVKVGSSIDDAEVQLRPRYGYDLRRENGNLELMDFEMGGFRFKWGTLNFQ